MAAASDIAPAIFDAADDDTVGAIVLRIDSPGGSPVASESILRAIEKAKEKGKLVIVSMSTAAASGGYWVAAYADRIFTMPMTMTGSIGVLGGKVAVQGLSDKAGVTWDRSQRWGENAGIWSTVTPFSESEAERMNAMLDSVYAQFIARVAKGRGMDKAEVEKIAKGRVWSGKRAVELGLADELGGLDAALDFAAKAQGLESRKDLNITVTPKPPTPLEHLMELLGTQAALGPALEGLRHVMEKVEPLSAQLRIIENPADYMAFEPLQVR